MKNTLFHKAIVLRILLLSLLVLPGAGLPAQDYPTCIARNGDGIYTLLERHGYLSSEFDEFVELNKSKLGKENSLFVGETYRLPVKDKAEPANEDSAGEEKTYKIFGKAYEKVTIP